MDSIPGSKLKVKDETILNLWYEFWNDYCRITHFHGFHEMRLSNDLCNKIFWIGVIFLGFAFSFGLTIVGVLHFIDEPVDTHVTNMRKGEIDFPVVYCPRNWIDKSKIIEGSEKYLLHALSYLQIPNFVYLPYDRMHYHYGIRRAASVYDDILPAPSDDDDILRSLLDTISNQMALYLSEHSPPTHYVGFPRIIMSSMRTLTYLFMKNNDRMKLINDMYPIYLQNQSDVLFEYVYYNLTFKYGVLRNVYNPKANSNQLQLTNFSPTYFLYHLQGYCFTLNDFNKLVLASGPSFNMTDISPSFFCKKPPSEEKSRQNFTHLSNIVNKQQTYLKLFRGYAFALECKERDNLFDIIEYYYCSHNPNEHKIRKEMETKRSKRMIELLSGDERIKRNNQWTDEENIKNYLENCCSDNETKFNEEVMNLVSKAERTFLAEEKFEFENFLKSHSFETPLDYLKNVSIDKGEFMVSFSVDPKKHIRPNSSNITAKRVITNEGMCILFRIQLNANNVGTFADDTEKVLIRESARQYPGLSSTYDTYSFSSTEAAYINIIIMQNLTSFFSQRTNIVSFGESAYAMSQQNAFYAASYHLTDKEISAYRNDLYGLSYNSFEIDSVRKINSIDRSATPCFERDLDRNFISGGLPYSYTNCRMSCMDVHSNPKTAFVNVRNEMDGLKGSHMRGNETEIALLSVYNSGRKVMCRELATCVYQAQNAHLLDGMEVCSFFNLHPIYENYTQKEKKINSSKALECFNTCLPPCKVQTFNIQHTQSDQHNVVVEIDSDNADSLIRFSAKNQSKRNELFWMPTSFETNISSYINFLFNVSKYIYLRQDLPYNRIEIIINTELTTFEEQPSFTWDTLFGVVGGQIALVMGASCLTLIQLFWLWTKSLYRYLSGKTRSIKLTSLTTVQPNNTTNKN